MSDLRCPQKKCNAPALLLLDLVCSNLECRNYDAKWYAEVHSKPQYRHDTIGDHTFLGGFNHQGKYYDLYHSINPLDESEWVEARYGDELSCYLGEELTFALFHESEVLHEAARRWDERIEEVS